MVFRTIIQNKKKYNFGHSYQFIPFTYEFIVFHYNEQLPLTTFLSPPTHNSWAVRTVAYYVCSNILQKKIAVMQLVRLFWKTYIWRVFQKHDI